MRSGCANSNACGLAFVILSMRMIRLIMAGHASGGADWCAYWLVF